MQVDVTALEDAASYYDNRHGRGWMDYWPEAKRNRIIEAIRELKLPHGSKVLEYGCGAGVITEAVAEALPEFEVHGCDISAIGVHKAQRRCQSAVFHLLDDTGAPQLPRDFDLVYSHHVLEHVTDLKGAIETIAGLLRDGGRVLHILPCGNPGSLEARITTLAGRGPDERGRFVTDDSSHVRRLTSAELIDASTLSGLTAEKAYFAQQFWGGIDYLTNYYYDRTLLRWVNPANGIDGPASVELLGLALCLYPISQLRHRPLDILRRLTKPGSGPKALLYWCAAPLALLAYPIGATINYSLARLREREWRLRKNVPSGGEMYVFLRKG